MIVKSVYRASLNVLTKIIGAPATKKLAARLRFKRKINLKNPVTLADKLCYNELFVDNPLKVKCTDKYEVREYVRSKGCGDLLIDLVGGPYSRVEEIDFDKLPNQFAMKATHGCQMNLLCEDKSKLDISRAKKLAKKWLRHDYPLACIEPHYQKIPHRIICEKLLQDPDSIIDYKFNCFYGEPDYVLVCASRVSGVKFRTYDMNWKFMGVDIGPECAQTDFPKPENFDRMVEISRKLSADFDYVRVDLYDINGKVYFGELTFSPASGVLYTYSDAFITEKGKKLKIEKKR